MNDIITQDTYDIIKHQARDLDLVLITRDSYITRTALRAVIIGGLIIALIFLSIARNNAEERAENFKAAAQQLKQNSENVAELRGILESQMHDIDALHAERNAYMAEVETLRRMRVMVSALEPYGFDWPNEKLESIATGTSELYTQRDTDEDEDDNY